VASTGKVASDFGCELMFIGGDIAGNDGPMVSPRIYREFILPEMRAQAGSLHKYGIFSFISSDGCLWPIIDDYLVHSGVDGMMEVQVTAGMDLDELKERFGDRISFTGSVDCQYTLTVGTPGDAADETRRAIDSLSPGGGHILCSSNSIHAGVKPENYLAMLRSAKGYGKFSS
jgi:uroporphyrinogen decarboxylase